MLTRKNLIWLMMALAIAANVIAIFNIDKAVVALVWLGIALLLAVLMTWVAWPWIKSQ